MIIT
jgi:serine/threonine-protein phosphatase PP1 catalytic subunit